MIIYLIDLLFYFTIKTLIILITLFVVVYNGFRLVRKLLFGSYIRPEGKAVLITGCDSGFGNRLAVRLAKMGFKVYATVLNTNSPGAQELQNNPDFAKKVLVLQMNVTNDIEVNEVYEKVKKDLEASGHVLWALVNNAGIASLFFLEWGTLDTYRKLVEVNLFGTVRVTRVFLPLIRASKGCITNVTSFAGRVSSKPNGVYSMTKYSVNAFSETLRRELIKFKVNVSIIEPGVFKTLATDPKLLTKQMVDFWHQSSDEVKEFYGSPEIQQKKILKMLEWYQYNENIDMVVDDMIDSVVNGWPKAMYRPMILSFKVLIYLEMFFPSLVDYIIKVFDEIF